jgi:hypothetical protein
MKWSIYNQSLVRRGEILLGFDVIDNWDAELKEMNKDKVGLGTVSYLTLFFFFFSCLDMLKCTFIFHIDRQKVLHKDTPKKKVPSIPDFTTINRRINRLNIKIKEDNNKNKEFEDQYIVIAVDSTGIKVNKQRSMDEREMACKKERIFKNTCSSS